MSRKLLEISNGRETFRKGCGVVKKVQCEQQELDNKEVLGQDEEELYELRISELIPILQREEHRLYDVDPESYSLFRFQPLQ